MTKRTVLYIDDNDDNIRLVERLLRRRPEIELRSVGTGRDGVQAAIEDPPVLILLDNRLPDTHGEQVLRQLAALPQTAMIPVIILSGDTGRETVDTLLAAGAVDFMAKPFDLLELMTLIERYLG
ncbi:MAG: response regulator [Streptosporangiaceae bacterium]